MAAILDWPLAEVLPNDVISSTTIAREVKWWRHCLDDGEVTSAEGIAMTVVPVHGTRRGRRASVWLWRQSIDTCNSSIIAIPSSLKNWLGCAWSQYNKKCKVRSWRPLFFSFHGFVNHSVHTSEHILYTIFVYQRNFNFLLIFTSLSRNQ